MRSKILPRLAIILLIEIGLVHYFSAQHEYEQASVLGYLFIANFLGALVAAYGIHRQQSWGWGLGWIISLGSLLAYVWSRTTGLPGLETEEWVSAWGLMALVTESLFCLLVFMRPWRSVPADAAPASPPNWRGRYALPAAGLIALVLVNFSTYQLDLVYPQEHIITLRSAQLTPQVSLDAFQEKYGVQVSRVAVSALDGIVDVRLKVLDVEKAEQLLEEDEDGHGHGALLAGDTLILAPHIHRVPMKEGKTIYVFYPNPKNVVTTGTPVSLVFEDARLEPVIAE
jgi:hypothetical protein